MYESINCEKGREILRRKLVASLCLSVKFSKQTEKAREIWKFDTGVARGQKVYGNRMSALIIFVSAAHALSSALIFWKMSGALASAHEKH